MLYVNIEFDVDMQEKIQFSIKNTKNKMKISLKFSETFHILSKYFQIKGQITTWGQYIPK